MKKILIIGAGFLQSFVIKKAKEMGYFTLAVDGDPNAVGFNYADDFAVIDITNEFLCLEYAKSKKIDGVLTAATDYGVMTASYIAKEMNLPGLDYEVAKTIKNKYIVRKRLCDLNIDDTKQSFEIDSHIDYDKLLEKVAFPIMVKPCDGSGSRGISRVDKSDNLREAIKTAIDCSKTRKAELETFIIGKEYGAESIVIDGKPYVLGIMQKWMTDPPYYAELGHAIPSDLPIDLENKVIKCVTRAILALNINFGSVNMDLLISDNGDVHIIDVGARMGGNMIGPCIIPYGTGIDYMGAMIQNAVGDVVVFDKRKRVAVASKILAFSSGVIRKLPNLGELEKKYCVEIYHHMENGQLVYDYHTNIDGLGYIIAKANSKEEAIKNANTVYSIIKECIFHE